MYGIYNPLFNTWYTRRGQVVLFEKKEQAQIYISVPERKPYLKPGGQVIMEYGKEN